MKDELSSRHVCCFLMFCREPFRERKTQFQVSHVLVESSLVLRSSVEMWDLFRNVHISVSFKRERNDVFIQAMLWKVSPDISLVEIWGNDRTSMPKRRNRGCKTYEGGFKKHLVSSPILCMLRDAAINLRELF